MPTVLCRCSLHSNRPQHEEGTKAVQVSAGLQSSQDAETAEIALLTAVVQEAKHRLPMLDVSHV